MGWWKPVTSDKWVINQIDIIQQIISLHHSSIDDSLSRSKSKPKASLSVLCSITTAECWLWPLARRSRNGLNGISLALSLSPFQSGWQNRRVIACWRCCCSGGRLSNSSNAFWATLRTSVGSLEASPPEDIWQWALARYWAGKTNQAGCRPPGLWPWTSNICETHNKFQNNFIIAHRLTDRLVNRASQEPWQALPKSQFCKEFALDGWWMHDKWKQYQINTTPYTWPDLNCLNLSQLY